VKYLTQVIPLPPVDWGGGIEKDVTLLELTNPENVTGLGSTYTNSIQMQRALDLFQQNPAILQRADPEMTVALSAVDIALWDILGQEMNQPVSELLGGRQRERVLAYATLDIPMESALSKHGFQKKLQNLIDQGFRAIKLSIDGFGHRNGSKSDSEWRRCEAAILESARHIVGDDISLMFDAYGSDPDWTPEFYWAVDTAKVLEKLKYLWFEEPLAAEAFDDYARLTQRVGIAIAGGEDKVRVEDFKALSDMAAVNILQPDCTQVGGITAMQAIRTRANSNDVEVVPHGWNTGVGLAADLHLQATTANDQFCMVEVMPDPSITNIFDHNPFVLDGDGTIAVPTGPGLGVTLGDKTTLTTFKD
jgi:L-alanine-DL-glutamate epimerase-like enolase superfamily enzyme